MNIFRYLLDQLKTIEVQSRSFRRCPDRPDHCGRHDGGFNKLVLEFKHAGSPLIKQEASEIQGPFLDILTLASLLLILKHGPDLAAN